MTDGYTHKHFSTALLSGHLLLLLSGLCFFSSPASGQLQGDDPARFVQWLRDDVGSGPRALAHANPLRLAAAVGLIAASTYYDETLSDELISREGRELMRVFEELGDANAARPAAILIFAGSLFQSNHRVQDAAFTSLEAIIFANMMTNALKAVAGRSRPSQNRGANRWKSFSGDTSFPSGHATTAFAAIAPWVLYYPHPLSFLALGVAAGTSVSRVSLNFHWPSDVLAGSFIGFSVGAWLQRQHTQSQGRVSVEPFARSRTLGMRIRF